MTLKDCIGFSESENPYRMSPIRYVRERRLIRKLISMVYNQQNSLVLTNKNNKCSHQTWYDLRDIITWRWRDPRSRSNKLFKAYTLTSEDSSFKKISNNQESGK